MAEEESNQRKSTMEEQEEDEEEEEETNSSSTALVAAETETTKTSAFAGNDDMISSLPDDLLHCIFSSLDIDYAIKCSVLSKRWRYLWTTLPNLNFNLEIPKGCYITKERQLNDRFRVFVNKVLSLRNGSTDTHKFRVKYSGGDRFKCILKKWIQYAISHNVEEFDITSVLSGGYGPGYYVKDEADGAIKPSLINDLCAASKSLRSLKLKTVYYPALIRPSFGLFGLKEMHLQDIRFVSGESLSNLISGCPVLETLVINRCAFGFLESLTLSSPHLKHLEISNLSCYDDIVDLKKYGVCNITVTTPKLVYLEFVSPVASTRNYSFGNMSSLMEARIYFYGGTPLKDSSEILAHVINFLRRLANVKSLRFQPNEWVLQEIPQHLSIAFHNLRFLELIVSQLHQRKVWAIAHLLQKCPNVERLVLVLYKADLFHLQREIIHDAADYPSQPILHHLKHVEIQNAVGREEEHELIRFLKNTAQLTDLVVIPLCGNESGSTINHGVNA